METGVSKIPAPERPGDLVADWCPRPQELLLKRAYLSKRVARCMAYRAGGGPKTATVAVLAAEVCSILDMDFREDLNHALG